MYLLYVSLNIAKHVVRIKVVSQVRNKAKTITNINKGSRIWQFGLHQEVLCFLWVIEVGLSCDSFNLFDLTCSGCCFYVFEVNIRVLTVTVRTICFSFLLIQSNK
jgi:hypothetical protein